MAAALPAVDVVGGRAAVVVAQYSSAAAPLCRRLLRSNNAPFSRDLSGGRPPTSSDLAAAARAGARWIADRDLPDPLCWDDFVRHPEETAAVVRRRVAHGQVPQRPHVFPLPKADGTLRRLLNLDPFDELILRTVVGRLTPRRRALYDTRVVLSSPVTGRGPSWKVGDVRGAHARRRKRAAMLLASSRCVGLGTSDIRDYYGSVDLGVLSDQLNRAGCPTGAVAATVEVLATLAHLSGVPGLPIGLEVSAFLGNTYLAPADHAFSRHGVPFLRWTDDGWAFPTSEAAWNRAIDDYQASVAELRLVLHPDKTGLLSKADANTKVQSALVEYMLVTSGNGSITAAQAAAELASTLEMANTFGDEIDRTGLRFCLGVLRSRVDPAGIRIIMSHPELMDREPTACGKYLETMANTASTRRHMDVEWLLDRAVRTPQGGTLAAQVQSLRALSHLHLPAGAGRQLLDVATDPALDRQVPLQQWAAWAWHRSEHWKVGRAGEAAEAAGWLPTKRAFAAGLCRGRGSAAAARALAHLVRQQPDLAPTAAWAA